MRQTAITVGHKSTLLAEARFYDDVYLNGDGGPVLFILDAVLVRGPSGLERLRIKRDVIQFPDEPSLIAAVTVGEWIEAPLEDRGWKPDVEQLEVVRIDPTIEEER